MGRSRSFYALDLLIPVCIAAVVVALFATPFALHHLSAPVGWDTAGYAWRTNFALQNGVRHLPAWLPAPGPTNPGRPGFVVVGGLLSSALGTTPLTMTAVMPAVSAAATGLAAGALTSVALGESRWVSAAVALGVGTSVFMVHIVNVEGYQDAAISAAVVVAAFTAVVLLATTWRALAGAVVLVAAAGVIHWELFQVVAAVLVVTALVYVPASIVQWRRGQRALRSSSTVRLLLVAGLGTAIAVLWIRVVVGVPLPRAELVAGQLAMKLHRDLPAFWPWLTLPLAAIGAALLANRASIGGESSARKRMFLVLVLSWSEITLAAFVGQRMFDRALPTHRLLAFDLAIPILVVLALCWGARAAATRGDPARAGDPRAIVGVAAVGVVLIAGAVVAGRQWLGFRPVVHPALLQEAATAARLLDRAHVSTDTPVVFVVQDASPDPWSQVWLLAHTIRAGLPTDRLLSTYFSVAPPWRPLPSDSSSSGGSSGTAASGASGGASGATVGTTPFWQYARDVRTIEFQDPVVFVTASSNPWFDRWVGTHPRSLVAPGLAVLDGAERIGVAQEAGAAVEAPSRIGAVRVAGLAMAALVILFLVGLGWCGALFGDLVRPRDRILLAPAVGLAMTALGGILLNALGMPLRGGDAWLVLALIGGVGAAAASLARVVRNRRHRPQLEMRG